MTAKQLLTDANLHATHWGQRIIAAEETGAFTAQDRDDANNWTTCACSKQDPRIPRNKFGSAPCDNTLRRIGQYFLDCVRADAYTEAAETLIAIERRAAEILADLPA